MFLNQEKMTFFLKEIRDLNDKLYSSLCCLPFFSLIFIMATCEELRHRHCQRPSHRERRHKSMGTCSISMTFKTTSRQNDDDDDDNYYYDGFVLI